MSKTSCTDTRVFLWCVPRSASTAFLKCMSNVPGVQVWNEPYTMAYVNGTLLNPSFLPENTKMTRARQVLTAPTPELLKILGNSPRGKLEDSKLFTYSWVKDQLEATVEEGKNCVFVKDMSFSVSGRHGDLPSSYRHTFLIRDPAEVYQSWKRIVATDMLRSSDEGSVDITTDVPFFHAEAFFKMSYELWKYATEIKGDIKPVVVDADDLVNHPELILPKYFKEIGLEFDDKYLQWDASQDVVQEWRGCFESTTVGGFLNTYRTAFRSSCFSPSDNRKIDVTSLPADVQKCIAASMPFYEAMYEARLTAD
ncbi:hypothetical protein HOLleu_37340 [Holothuria leucospilota]|uniref:Sulfotransferase family protein n=1 Tax=Holothuria leucospilota TaxID=206669 RepID=A0A9Q1BF74_HOLLE|nr:hypothetical protein HOLleu_37340 [Holothuria leucospilota]